MLTPQIFRLVGASVLSLGLLLLAGTAGASVASARDRDSRRNDSAEYKKNDKHWRSTRSPRRFVNRHRDEDGRKSSRRHKDSKRSKKHHKNDRHHDRD